MAKIVELSLQNGKLFWADEEVPEGGEIRPHGSIGYFRWNNGTLTRLSGSGRPIYRFTPKQAGLYKAGPNFTHRVKPASEEKDPILRVLRQMEIPVSKLRRMDTGEALLISTFSCDIWRAYPEGTTNNYYITDGCEQAEVTSYKDMTPVNQYCGSEVHESGQIGNATYAIEVVQRVHMNSSIGTYIGEVAVWPSCDPRALAKALAPIVFGSGADAEYVDALKDFEAAQQWIAGKFEIAPHEKGDRVVVNGSDFLVESEYLRDPRVLDRLLRKHGVRLIEEHLGDKQLFFLRAKDSVGVAVQYVLTHYRVVVVKRGQEQHLKFALDSSREKLGDIDSVYLGGGEELPLKTLLSTHDSLKDVLFEWATERMELVPTYPHCRRFRLQDEVWEVHCDWDGEYKSDDFRPVAREEDAISVRLGEGEFSKQLLCLSGPERRKGTGSMGGFQAVLRDGDEAYINAYNALLQVRVGETKNFVLNIKHEWASPGRGASIWGVTLRRTKDGVVYEAYDNGKLYTCAGFWGGEVSAKPIA